MFITLTNASPAHKGNKVVLNAEFIVSIHRATITRPTDKDDEPTVVEDVTFVHCPPHGTWEVEESVGYITDLLSR